MFRQGIFHGSADFYSHSFIFPLCHIQLYRGQYFSLNTEKIDRLLGANYQLDAIDNIEEFLYNK